jgi:nucleoside-diphosphate-sugar epimerase
VIEAAASVGALLVVAENLYGYGPVAGAITEDLPLRATTRKGAVRALMWHQLEAAHNEGRVKVVAARGSDFFGKDVSGSAVGDRFFNAILKQKPVGVGGDPDRLHTYTYVGDFGEAMVRLSETPATWGRAWHVPNSPTVSTRAFAEQAATTTGASLRLRPYPRWQLRLLGTVVPAVRETVEMLYQFESDFVVDHSAYAAVLGDHATPVQLALEAALR